MSNQVSLKAQRRTALGRNAVKKVKAEKAVPAILYGSGVEPQTLQVERRAIDNLLSHAVGENILVNLEIEDDGKGERGEQLALVMRVLSWQLQLIRQPVRLLAVAAHRRNLLAQVVDMVRGCNDSVHGV